MSWWCGSLCAWPLSYVTSLYLFFPVLAIEVFPFDLFKHTIVVFDTIDCYSPTIGVWPWLIECLNPTVFAEDVLGNFSTKSVILYLVLSAEPLKVFLLNYKVMILFHEAYRAVASVHWNYFGYRCFESYGFAMATSLNLYFFLWRYHLLVLN